MFDVRCTEVCIHTLSTRIGFVKPPASEEIPLRSPNLKLPALIATERAPITMVYVYMNFDWNPLRAKVASAIRLCMSERNDFCSNVYMCSG